MDNNKVYTFRKHDCEDCRNVIYSNTEYYTMERCMICERVIKFRWKSLWKRIVSFF